MTQVLPHWLSIDHPPSHWEQFRYFGVEPSLFFSESNSPPNFRCIFLSEPIVLREDFCWFFSLFSWEYSGAKINHMDSEISQVENVQSLMRNLF